MSRRTTGALFISLSVIVYCVKYICAGLYSITSIGVSMEFGTGEGAFKEWIGFMTSELTVVSVILLILGLIYLVVAEVNEKKD